MWCPPLLPPVSPGSTLAMRPKWIPDGRLEDVSTPPSTRKEAAGTVSLLRGMGLPLLFPPPPPFLGVFPHKWVVSGGEAVGQRERLGCGAHASTPWPLLAPPEDSPLPISKWWWRPTKKKKKKKMRERKRTAIPSLLFPIVDVVPQTKIKTWWRRKRTIEKAGNAEGGVRGQEDPSPPPTPSQAPPPPSVPARPAVGGE